MFLLQGIFNQLSLNPKPVPDAGLIVFGTVGLANVAFEGFWLEHLLV